MLSPSIPSDIEHAQKKIFWMWNILLSFSGLTAFFFLLTDGIPFVQWGWMETLGSNKELYEKYTRFALLIFLMLLFVCYRFFPRILPRLWIARAGRALLDCPSTFLMAVLFVLHTTVLTWGGWIRHDALESRGFDLGIFAQAVWNTTRGDWLYSSIKGGINLLGDHVSPILFLIAPLYAFWPDPKLLILLQAVSVASCIFMIGALAQRELKSRFFVTVFVLMYFFNAPTRAALHNDFHPESLVEPFLYLAFIALENRQIPLYLLMLILSATAKEGMLTITFMFGIYTSLFKRERILGTGVVLVSLGLFLWEVRWLVPQLNPSGYYYDNIYANLFQLSREGNLLQRILDPDSWEYLFKVFFPFAFLPFFHVPTLTLAFPVLFQNLLSTRDVMRSLHYHYNFGLIPFVFISSIYGFKRLSESPALRRVSPSLLGAVLLAVSLLRSGPSEYSYLFESANNLTPHAQMVTQKLRSIPTRYSVLTHNSFSAQLPNRRGLYHFDYNDQPTKSELASQTQADYVVFDSHYWEEGAVTLQSVLEEILRLGYKIEFANDGFYIFAKL